MKYCKLLILLVMVITVCTNAAVTVKPVDTTTQGYWRTAAALEVDSEYGTDGYVVYGLNEADSVYAGTYDTVLANPATAVSLPVYISDISFAGSTGMWSGNGNFGYIEDPGAENALTACPILANGPVLPYVVTITRATPEPFRLTIFHATGDGNIVVQSVAVDAGSAGSAVGSDPGGPAAPAINYLVYEIGEGTDPITITMNSDIPHVLTGFAFDTVTGAHNPDPVNDPHAIGAKIAVDDVWLSWNTGLDVTDQINVDIRKHYVYGNFDDPSDPNLYLIAEIDAGVPTQATALHGPLNLERDQIYKWQVEEGLDDGDGGVYLPGDPNNVASSVWTFYSALSVADIDPVTPVDQLVDPEVTPSVDIVVDAINPFYPGGTLTGPTDGLAYQWQYDDGEGFVDIAEATSATLTLSVALGDGQQGAYRCAVSIADDGTGGSKGSVNSRAAMLLYKELVAHWPLDGDPNDASGNGYDGAEVGEVTYGEGVCGTQAAEFNGIDTMINCGDVPVAGTGHISLSFWVKPANVSKNWAGVISKWNATDRTFWMGQHSTDGYVRFGIYPNGGTGEATMDTNRAVLSNGEWTHMVATYDSHTQKLYADGLLVLEGPDRNAPIPNFVGDLLLGYVDTGGDNWFAGSIDDVRVYNFALTKYDVADLYVECRGPICADQPTYDISGPDGSPDCKVTLVDIAVFAAQWSECGTFPNCITEVQ